MHVSMHHCTCTQASYSVPVAQLFVNLSVCFQFVLECICVSRDCFVSFSVCFVFVSVCLFLLYCVSVFVFVGLSRCLSLCVRVSVYVCLFL